MSTATDETTMVVSRARARRAPTGTGTTAKPTFWRGLASGIGTGLLVTLVALALLIAVIPRVLGGAALTVLSGSMEPTLSVGDVVVSAPQATYATGDVITFQPTPGDPTLITHRIVAVGSSSQGLTYTTRGDANGTDDDPIVADQVMGKVRYSIPWIGNVTSLAGGHRQGIVTAAAIALIGYGAFSFVSGMLDSSRRKKSASSADAAFSTEPTNSKDAS